MRGARFVPGSIGYHARRGVGDVQLSPRTALRVPAAIGGLAPSRAYCIIIVCEKPREETMPRFMLALIMCCATVHGAAAAGGSATAAAGELSSCLDCKILPTKLSQT